MTSLCNAAFWISLIAVNQVSPVMVSSPFNIAGTLLFFAVVSFVNLMFILLAVPETKVSFETVTTVEPLCKGHFGASCFVLCSEVVPFSMNYFNGKGAQKGVLCWKVVPFSEVPLPSH